MAGCAYGHFWVPDDQLLNQYIPGAYVQPLDEHRTLYRIAPEEKDYHAFHYQKLTGLDLAGYQTARFTQRVMAVVPPYAFVIPRAGGLFSGVDAEGIVQFHLKDEWGTRMTEFNSNLPGTTVNQLAASPDGRLWIAGGDGASVFDPKIRRMDVFDDWNTFEQDGGGLSESALLFTYTPSVSAVETAPDGHAYFGTGRVFQYTIEDRSWRRWNPVRMESLGTPTEQRLSRTESVTLEWKDSEGKRREKRVKYNVRHIYQMEPHRIRPSAKGHLDGSVDGLVHTSVGLWIMTQHGLTLTPDGGSHFRSFVAGHEDWGIALDQCTKEKKISHGEASAKVCVERTTRYLGSLYVDSGHGLPGPNATALAEVRPGVIWAAFSPSLNSDEFSGGLRQYVNGQFEPVGGLLFEGRRITAIAVHKGRAYVAVMDVLYEGGTDGNGFAPVPLWDGVEEKGAILSLASDGEFLWAMTGQGLMRIRR